MNKNILKISTLVAIWAFCSQNATAQQGFGTNQPSKASVIEMKSGTKGLLIPRVALTDLNNFGPIIGNTGITPAETNSLMVYNTTTDTTANLSAGYYYWTATDTNDGTIGYWQRLMTGTDEAALALDGDVTGLLDNTIVGKIQGRNVANTAPNTNQVLTWNGSAWTPTSLTPAQITNKATLSVQDGIAITAGSGTDALLGAATIGITDGGIAPVKIQPAAEPTTRMVMVTQTDGTVTWIPQTDIAPTTTNALTSVVNSMTSNVNGVSSSAYIINSNGLSVTGTELTSTVNGVPATVDLAPAVTAATTHTLGMSGNTLTSIVNGVSPTVDVVTSNTLVLTDNELVSTVNGVATTPAVDLSKYLDNTDNQTITNFSVTGNNLSITIENGNTMTVPLSSIDTDNQTITNLSLAGNVLSITLERGGAPVTVDLTTLTNTTNLGNGTNTTVSGNGSATTPYEVNVATGNGTTLGVVKEAATNPSVAVAADGSLSVNIANITDRGSLSASTGDNSITVNNGTNATFVNTDIKVTDGGISTAKIANNAVTVQKLPAGATNTTFLRGDGAWVTPTDNNTTYSGSASVILDGTSFQRAALTGDVTAPQNSNVTTITNDAVTARTINPDVAGTGLSQAANGALQVDYTAVETELADGTLSATNGAITVTDGANATFKDVTLAVKAVSGVEIHDDNVKLGGSLTRATTITQDGNAFTIATGESNLNISGLDKTKVQATDATAGITDRLLAVDGNDKVKALKAAMPKFFYMPSVMVPTAESHLGQAGVTFDNSTRTGTINLYTIYVAQFGSPVASTNTGALPVLPIKDLDFHITYATPDVFTITGIDANTGMMTYTVSATANVTNGSFINIVFSVKED